MVKNIIEMQGYSPLPDIYGAFLKSIAEDLNWKLYLSRAEGLGKVYGFPYRYNHDRSPIKHDITPESQMFFENTRPTRYGDVVCYVKPKGTEGHFSFFARTIPYLDENGLPKYPEVSLEYDMLPDNGNDPSLYFIFPHCRNVYVASHLPRSFRASTSTLAFYTPLGQTFPCWNAFLYQDKERTQLEKIQRLALSYQLDELFLEGAITGELPGFRQQQDVNVSHPAQFNPMHFNIASPFSRTY
ncbi:hypothetical protein A3A93_04305 [Candidatus Roizmanbacteria bacterium RIFCSPLOWO2_01_FULL_38_12]|uniref:Uncharacterized protein n=1 Tax=Candidatus Roizmanbacteria bacterium RIFCSPLOWO2_01_FULL_38_12 TaxID=1802061 RepID=A0A1F7IXB0_9BACT|nr:MAG: hypothetical protein A2861_01190 [Candidatus Roizmanbacteria bacterium RIFCSPHIGHO2_01_FULL_38_15]OGK35463.1 MAG: hypothetical protein A3F59_00810 [Candidatus Roizmanbacteria bacterium RIFCSPHIGHO2_12_FULL_38_13]OGK47996.1 MAG: hypothetical protein A3A93_04305 [Candidatus Roizmanbacteria bacterium RIFCSPLOWO2_01_FULL_38_12]